jgi:hypothetical protein
MANWSNPTLSSTYTDFLSELKARDTDLALQFDGTTSSNLATGTIRWNSTTNRWQKWSGSAWAELTGTYALTALTTTGNASIGGTLAVTGATTLAAATATTPATGNNSTAVATTAYVRAQAYAPLASPALTGTPTVPSAAVDTNTTQAASTAFVLGQAGSTAPVINGTAAVGSSLRYSRQDHVHPIDTSRAPVASPTLTGTPAAPTAAVGTNTTQLATTAFVNAEIANDAPTKTGAGASGTWGISVTGNAATVTTNANLTGDITSVGNATSIAAGVIVNADISGSAGIALSKLATGALPTAITVASANLVNGTIVDADISDSAAIAGTKVDPNFGIGATVGCGAVDFGSGSGSSGVSLLLDKYEEGTWTPVVSDAASGGNTATGTFYGHYTVIGNLCTVTVSLANLTTTGMTAANDLFIQGLPFAADSLTGTVLFTGAVEVHSCTVVNSPCLEIIDNAAYIRIAESAAGAARDLMIVSEFTSGSADVYGTVTYQIA